MDALPFDLGQNKSGIEFFAFSGVEKKLIETAQVHGVGGHANDILRRVGWRFTIGARVADRAIEEHPIHALNAAHGNADGQVLTFFIEKAQRGVSFAWQVFGKQLGKRFPYRVRNYGIDFSAGRPVLESVLRIVVGNRGVAGEAQDKADAHDHKKNDEQHAHKTHLRCWEPRRKSHDHPLSLRSRSGTHMGCRCLSHVIPGPRFYEAGLLMTDLCSHTSGKCLSIMETDTTSHFRKILTIRDFSREGTDMFRKQDKLEITKVWIAAAAARRKK